MRGQELNTVGIVVGALVVVGAFALGMAVGEPQMLAALPVAPGVDSGQFPCRTTTTHVEDAGPNWLSPR